jgi:hypothetical protein
MNKKLIKICGIILATVITVYAMIYIDVVLRAREAYLQGEKYLSWHEKPELKKTDLDRELAAEKLRLDKKLAAGKITKEEYSRQTDICTFNHERKLEESSIKYAYVWYRDVIQLFSPPESKWVKLAKQKMPLAKEKWKEELTKKGIPFEEYMLD